jgi:hypothetical protein
MRRLDHPRWMLAVSVPMAHKLNLPKPKMEAH